MNLRETFLLLPLALFAGLIGLPASASTNGIVISQVYGGGGNSGAPYQNDYIELFNSGGSAVDIGGWSVQYASSTGSNWNNATAIPANTTLQPGQYYLIAEAAGSGNGSPLPTADLSGTITMSSSKGKVALVSNTTSLSGSCPLPDANIVDFVGFGSANCQEGSAPAPGLNNTTAALRADAGCTDSDDNSSDFTADTPNPRNTANTPNPCGGSGGVFLSVADVSLPEGDSGTTTFTFTVSLSNPAPAGGVSFDIATADGTATTADNDYVANSVTGATIAEGNSSYTFDVDVNGDTTPEPDETFSVKVSNITGATNSTATATGTIENDDIANLAIYDIQGSPSTQGPDGASPYVGQTVHTSGIVTMVESSGFYLQTPDAQADSDPLTSNAVYVYGPSAAGNVQIGDAVQFDADVDEYYRLTELKNVANLIVDSSGNPLPTAVEFDAATPSPDPDNLSCGDTNFECFEGMLVHIDNGFVSTGSGYSSQHTYDYLYVTANGRRSLRGPGLKFGLSPTAGKNDTSPVWDGNPEVFEMEPNEFTGVNDDSIPVNGGSTFTATGVISYSFGAYQFYPTSLNFTYKAPMPRPVADGDPSELRVGSFNVQRFCDDVDDTVPGNPDPIPPGKELYECAGGSAPPTTAEYDEKAQRLADYIGTVLNLPDVVAVQEVENIGALTKLADDLNNDYGIVYTPKLIEGNDVSGIDVGFLVNEARVNLVSVQQLDKDLMWHTPNNHDRPVFDHPPLLLQGYFTGGGQNQPFMVMVNHLKSRTQVDKVDSSGEPTDDALEDQEKRFRQAYAVAKLVQDLQSSYSSQAAALRPAFTQMASPADIPLMVVGDFNDYQFSDGYADLTGMISGKYDFAANWWKLSDLTEWDLQPILPLPDKNIVKPPLWNAIASLPENERYSYLYSVKLGNIQGYSGSDGRKVPTDQALDHALLNEAAQGDFARMDYGRANQDAASEDEHNSTGAIGSSDHDGFVLQMTFDRIFADGFENRD